MAEATRLTRAGNLVEATALLQSLLAKKTADSADLPDETVIEGTFTQLDEDRSRAAKPQASAAKAQASRPRRSLGETLRNIAAGGMPDRADFKGPAVSQPAGAEFITMVHANCHGQRDYKLYRPAKRSPSPMPLIVMLHGCTQSPDDFAAGTGMNALAELHGFMVAYPAQSTGANSSKCWNWFKTEDQKRDRGEPELIAGMVRDILRDHPVDPARVYIAGLSAGGATAAIVAAAYPDLFSAAGVHSGMPVGAAKDISQAFSAMRSGAVGTALSRAVPTIVIHGLADKTVHPSNGTAAIDQTLQAFDRLHKTTRKGTSAGGRRFRVTGHTDGEGRTMVEHWQIEKAGHAWAGGQPEGSFTDPTGPKASEEMVRFFLQHARK